MLKFDLIGSIDLRRDDGKEIDQLLRQPKRLALLAYLAAPTPGTWHRRDTLLGLFWPELDAARARTALRNALYVLRQALGDGVVATRGDEEVSLDPTKITTDLSGVWSAVHEGRAEDALALIKGDLLPGLYPGETEDFNSWLDAQRAKVRTEVARVAAARVEQLEREQRTADALRLARRILEITPGDETAVRRVLGLHDAIGDRSGGLAAYERFASWLREEFGAEPAAETVAIAARLRRANEAPRRVSSPVADAPLVTETAQAAPHATPQRRAPRRAIIATTALAAIVMIGWLANVFGRGSVVALGASFPVTSDEGLQIEPALSLDGRLVAYARGTTGHMRIWVQRIAGGASRELTTDSAANELVPRWSPDGEQVLYLSRNHAWTSTAFGGTPRIVASGIDDDHAITSASWSPRGDSVAFVRDDSLMVKPIEGPGARFVGTARQLHSCVWSRDGVWIACVTGNWISFVPGPLFGNRAPSGIVLFRATGGAPIALTDSKHEHESPTWSPDSRELWVLSNRDGESGEVFAIAVGRDGNAVGAPRKVGFTAQWISCSDTRVAYAKFWRWGNVWSLPLPAGNATSPLRADDAKQVTFGQRITEIVTVSPDGRWLVYDSDKRGNSDIYRVPIETPGDAPERLTNDLGNEFVGSISPDGQELVWHITGEVRTLRVMRLADGAIETPFPSDSDQNSPRWSPDGRALAAWVNDGGGPGAIFVLRRDAHGSWTRQWQLYDGQLPVWSPDGTELAFVTKSGKVELIAADSGPVRVLYAPRAHSSDPLATNVVWKAGRQSRWFIGNTPRGDGGIWTLPLSGGRPAQVVTLTTLRATGYGPVFDTDGKRFYFVLDERHANVQYAELVMR